jgi:endonuclease-3 related protein
MVFGAEMEGNCPAALGLDGPGRPSLREQGTAIPESALEWGRPYSHLRAMSDTRQDAIRAYYDTLFSIWGRQHWWPAQSRFEVIVGAYLTQNTAWTNVEKALANLRRARVLTIQGIRRTPQAELERWIRPAGYFRQKAQRLKTFVSFLDERYDGSLARMFARPTAELREELLALHGVGPETADSILLYAGNHPIFVVDAYTRRILERHEMVSSAAGYDEIRQLFERSLGAVPAVESLSPPRRREDPRLNSKPSGTLHRPSAVSEASRSPLVQVFNEMHGLIVGVGKNYCLKSQPQCEQCPLQKFLPRAK